MTQRTHRIEPNELAITVDEWHAARDRAEATDIEIVRFHQPHPAFLVA